MAPNNTASTLGRAKTVAADRNAPGNEGDLADEIREMVDIFEEEKRRDRNTDIFLKAWKQHLKAKRLATAPVRVSVSEDETVHTSKTPVPKPQHGHRGR